MEPHTHLCFSALLLTIAAAAAAPNDKPVSFYFNLCKRNDPNLSDCVKKTIIEAKPKFIKGIPELDLIPLDPLLLPKLDFSRGLGLEFILTNTTIKGLRNLIIQDVRADMKQMILETTMFTPDISFDGSYDMNGRIIILPVKGSGQVTFNFRNVTTKSTSYLEKYNKNGKEYIRVKEMKWDIDPQFAKSSFTNLFNGDKTLGDATNRFLNDNWREAFSAYKHLPEAGFGKIFKELINRVYPHYTFQEWFPL